jgi:Cu-Zn family superoxide dismutase
MKTPTLAAAILAAAMAPAAALAEGAATATLTGPDGAAMGTVTLTAAPHGVLVSADVTGLAPGPHGFHIHETGACAPDFKAAGGHYNPAGAGHGLMHEGGHHAGDLPNIHANAEGAAQADYFTADVSFDEGAANTLFDADGSAIIIHENPDSYGEDAGAGGRVACGVIERH